MSKDIAVVGMACQFPDADSPHQLWENVLAGRRAFRQIPDERMRGADYWSADRGAPDRFYARKAAVLEGYSFDRVRYRDIRWQGRCREMFLFEEAPGVLEELRSGLRLFTVKAECEYMAEISALDVISIRMRLEELTQPQVGFAFDYARVSGDAELLIARGRQRVACMRLTDGVPAPVRVPDALRRALLRYAQDQTAAGAVA